MTNNDSNQQRKVEQTIFKEESSQLIGVKQPTSTGLDENIAGLLCYIIPIVGLVFFFIEKENKFVRFHAVQVIILALTIMVVSIGIGILSAVLSMIKLGWISFFITGPFVLLIGPIIFFLIIFMAYQAYQGKMFKLPIIGNLAEKHSEPK